MFIPDVDELKRKMKAGFDFESVTRDLLRPKGENDNNGAEAPGSLSRWEAKRLVNKLEEHAFGPRKRKRIAKAGHTLAITRHENDRKAG